MFSNPSDLALKGKKETGSYYRERRKEKGKGNKERLGNSEGGGQKEQTTVRKDLGERVREGGDVAQEL